MTRRRARSTLFPYTTLFRSMAGEARGTEPGERSPMKMDPVREGARAEQTRAKANELALTHQLVTKYRSEEHTSELQSLRHLVCRLLLEKKKKKATTEDISIS